MIHQNHDIFILPGYIFHNTALTQSCMTGECFHLLLPGQPECFPHGNGLLLSFQNFGQINICFFQTYSFFVQPSNTKHHQNGGHINSEGTLTDGIFETGTYGVPNKS